MKYKFHKWIEQGGDVFACKWCKRRLRVDVWAYKLPKGSVRSLPVAQVCPVTVRTR